MDTYTLSKQFTERFQAYLNSDCFRELDPHTKSEYWEYHSDQIGISVDNGRITLEGKSGYYIPAQNEGNDWRNALTPHIMRLKKLLHFMRTGTSFLTYCEAFDKVMSHEPIADIYLSPERVNFLKLRENPEIIGAVREIEERFYARHKYNPDIYRSRNAHLIRTYYYYNILRGHIDFGARPAIAEIGAGNGNLISLLYHSLPGARCIIIDLPETICLSAIFVADIFPDAKICLPHEIAPETDLAEYDFVFLTPKQTDSIRTGSVDLAINTASFHEMTHAQIAEYFELIQRMNKEGGYFFTTNRVEKIPSVSDTENFDYLKNEVQAPVNRFTDYPWDPRNEIVVFEVCRLIRLVALDDYFIRLERIRK